MEKIHFKLFSEGETPLYSTLEWGFYDFWNKTRIAGSIVEKMSKTPAVFGAFYFPGENVIF